MRVALISDIHANEIALRAVLADIGRMRVDQVVCLGDVATLGPRPTAVIEILRECGCACIMGNHDEFLLDPALLRTYSEHKPVIDAVEWCRSELGREDLDFLRGFERGRHIPLDEGSTLFVFHGAPRSNMVDILATTDADRLDDMLAGHNATVMACGHTHLPMLRQHRGTLLVNPGSVGLPFQEYVAGRAPTVLAHAEYATIEAADGRLSVSLHRVPLDARALHDAAQASDVPLRHLLMQQYC
jgi:predicted phosphodiesterase